MQHEMLLSDQNLLALIVQDTSPIGTDIDQHHTIWMGFNPAMPTRNTIISQHQIVFRRTADRDNWHLQ